MFHVSSIPPSFVTITPLRISVESVGHHGVNRTAAGWGTSCFSLPRRSYESRERERERESLVESSDRKREKLRHKSRQLHAHLPDSPLALFILIRNWQDEWQTVSRITPRPRSRNPRRPPSFQLENAAGIAGDDSRFWRTVNATRWIDVLLAVRGKTAFDSGWSIYHGRFMSSADDRWWL